MEIIGHRGCVGLGSVENTVSAVERALGAGADGVEVDVRVTADGIAVCAHDPSLLRVAGAAIEPEGSTYAALRQIRTDGEQLAPSLAEVASVVGDRGLLVAELKPTRHDPAAATRAALAALGGRADVVIYSFDPDRLSAVHELEPHRRTALLTSAAVSVAAAVLTARALGCTEVHPHLSRVIRRPHGIQRARSVGLRVVPWTVRTLEQAGQLTGQDVDAMICDDPGLVRASLQGALVAAS